VIKTACVMVGMLGIENYDTREGKLEIVLGEVRWAHHQLLASESQCVHKKGLQAVLYPAVNKLRCPDRRKPANRQPSVF